MIIFILSNQILPVYLYSANEEVDRNKASFAEDQSIHPYFRSKNSDYKVNRELSSESIIRKDYWIGMKDEY